MARDLKEAFDPMKEIELEQAHKEFKEMIADWIKSYPWLKNYLRDRFALYFTYYKYEKTIRQMIYTTNWIEKLNKDFKRVIKMRGAMPNADSALLLLANVAKNRECHKFPIYQFKDTCLFNEYF